MAVIEATTTEAYKLIHEGSLALAKVEANGICVDTEYITKQQQRLQRKMDRLERQFLKTELGSTWLGHTKYINKKMSLTKDEQLRHVLYKILKVKSSTETDKGTQSVSADILQNINVEGIPLLLKWKKYKKAKDTFLASVLRETVNGIVNPTFNLHLVTTYRGSSNDPNFQNQPKRDEEIQKIIRRAFKPRPGRHLLEVDYSGVEVRVPCFYHSDQNLIDYVSDPTKDMHRDMAAQNYMLKHSQVTKAIRYGGKNQCVFPWFYGDWPGSTGPVMWEAAKSHILEDGTKLIDHLRSKGINSLDQFVQHHTKAYDDFWGRRFKVYAQWKEDVWKKYERDGYVEMLTGFRCSDIAIYNEVINRPIQGTAFHLLLWSLIEMQKEIEKRGLKTLIVGQIHDSLVMDVPPEEIDIIMRLARSIMIKRVARHWPWINVPMEIEAELTPRDGSWYELKEITKEHGGCCSKWLWEEKKEDCIQLTCPICLEKKGGIKWILKK